MGRILAVCTLFIVVHKKTTFLIICVGSVIVKCSQTNKKLTAKPMDLHPDSDEPLSRSHLVPGCRLMLDESGKHYPVQFVCFAGMSMHDTIGIPCMHEHVVVYTY